MARSRWSLRASKSDTLLAVPLDHTGSCEHSVPSRFEQATSWFIGTTPPRKPLYYKDPGQAVPRAFGCCGCGEMALGGPPRAQCGRCCSPHLRQFAAPCRGPRAVQFA